MSGILDLLEESENEFVFVVESEGACGHEEIANICSSLSGVSVKREECVEFGDVLGGEDWVLG